MRAIALNLFIAASLVLAQAESDVQAFVRSLAATLADAHDADGTGRPDAGPFLEKFDSSMPGLAELRDEVQSLVARADVGSAIEIASDEGDGKKRTLQLDWVLEIQDQPPRRKLVKCTIERPGKEWKITSFEPIDFFKY